MANTIAIIPARKGSVGIPGKNYYPICGKPLVYWSLLAAYQSSVDTIVLTTNCPEVKQIGLSFRDECDDKKRIHVIGRPKSCSTSLTPTEETMDYALNYMQKKKPTYYDFVILLQPTSPARKNGLIDVCLHKLLNSPADSILTCSEHTPFFFKRGIQFLKTIPDNIRAPRQMLRPSEMYLHDTGNVYITRYNSFTNYGRIGRKTIGHVISDFESMQIDKPADILAMEALAEIFGGFL